MGHILPHLPSNPDTTGGAITANHDARFIRLVRDDHERRLFRVMCVCVYTTCKYLQESFKAFGKGFENISNDCGQFLCFSTKSVFKMKLDNKLIN